MFGIWLEKSSQLELADADLKTIVHTSFELANTKSPLLGSPSLLVLGILILTLLPAISAYKPLIRSLALSATQPIIWTVDPASQVRKMCHFRAIFYLGWPTADLVSSYVTVY